ncbi:putative GNAT superfamily acetyltransferase [Rhodobacter viridis]|uniref:Putative GNAT superfamily acetyltransferase n=1 Tax=Rhodobacter viridis TaxID=1054202 RepID=A0A318TRM0_9RHOB|nr:GNAT family N-acetyltransferase [Rhodobacter viridis]PYF07492.1 putative GNAT superfamily acetyltransferase [Rhodobacter viridis]
MTSGVILRELNGVAELQQAERFQVEVWGEGERPDNSDIMLALQHEGALVAGAFAGDQMLGFLFGFPSATPGVQHSHRLAVSEKARGLGLGARLKWFQRDWCLARGIRLVRWTYDPLRAINAGLNIAVLGATAREYLPDYYGEMPGINAGLPSDRVMAVWQLDAPRVVARAAGQVLPTPFANLEAVIPADIDALLLADPERALTERLQLRASLQTAFDAGLTILGFDRKRHRYLLGRLAQVACPVV